MLAFQLHQEAGRVIYISVGVEHVLDAAEMLGMEAVIDLHAAEVDEFRTVFTGLPKGLDSLLTGCREQSFSVYIQGVRL